VWAIDAERLPNYLLPRDCPRVTYYAGPETTIDDRNRFLRSCSSVVALEEGWLERVRSCRLYCYQMPPETFECVDECAGYFVSRTPVLPVGVEVFDEVLAELKKRDVDVRILPNLWPLRDAVAASSLRFSMIRMRNARPRNSEPPPSARAAGHFNLPRRKGRPRHA
jgi:hypothetical protein